MNVNAVTTATKSTPCLAKGNALTASGYRVESGASQQPTPLALFTCAARRWPLRAIMDN
jgi:hypothetical protein